GLQLVAGDVRAALASYQESKSLAKRLSGSEASRMEAVADADAGMAAAWAELGNREASCAAYGEARDIYRALAAKAALMIEQADHQADVEKAVALCPAR